MLVILYLFLSFLSTYLVIFLPSSSKKPRRKQYIFKSSSGVCRPAVNSYFASRDILILWAVSGIAKKVFKVRGQRSRSRRDQLTKFSWRRVSLYSVEGFQWNLTHIHIMRAGIAEVFKVTVSKVKITQRRHRNLVNSVVRERLTLSPPLDNILSYGDFLEVKREYYQNCSVLGCVTQCSVSSTLIWAVLTGPADWVCHIGTLMSCIEAVA